MLRRLFSPLTPKRAEPVNRLLKSNHVASPRGNGRALLGVKEGSIEHGFRVKTVTNIPDFESIAYAMVHEGTGAEYLHIDRADTNNAFGVLFRTIPEDDTGVAHILEHTMLCGSREYPVRDPFFNMLKRSLSSFMNAMTASDWVLLPFSTQNERDFQNLLSVYLDAAFFPNLNELDFRQEGHRLEVSSKDGDSGEEKVLIKGVVFNEMKGAMSDPSRFMRNRLSSLLFETNTYHFNSGGEPRDIPNLTWQQLKAFHSRYFHPSNAKFFTYGDMGPSLEKIGAVCNAFQKIEPNSEIQLEPRRINGIKMQEPCPVTPGEAVGKDTKVVISWMCNDIGEDINETFGLNILSQLLLSGPSSPFYKSLIAPNIGTGYSPCTGYSPHTRQATFGVGLVGIKEEDVSRVEDIVRATLEECASTGFEENRIEAVIHQIELSQKTVKSNFGLECLLRMTSVWNYEVDPLAVFQVNEMLANLRQNLESGPYFQGLIKKHLLENPHKVTLSQTADPTFLERLKEEEQSFLEAKEADLTSSDKENLKEQATALKANQEAVQDVSVLPSLAVEDIPQDPERVLLTKNVKDGVELFESHQPTNGILYFRTTFDLKGVPEELIPLLPFYASCLTSTGAGNLDPSGLSDEIKLYTGGISAGVNVSDSIFGFTGERKKAHQFYLNLSSYALSRNIQKKLDLMKLIMLTPNFNFKERLESLLRSRAQGKSSSLLTGGHSYAMTWASKEFSAARSLNESLGGITQVEFLNDLAKNSPSNLDEIIAKLEKIHSIILGSGVSKAMVSGDRKTLNGEANGNVEEFLSQFDTSSSVDEILTLSQDSTKTFITLPAQVNFCAKAIPTVPYTNEDAPALRVLGKIISLNFLHKEIREKGGAYGSGASQSDGQFSFFSYRDPETKQTIETFDKAVNWAVDGGFTDRDINEALLSLFSGIDKPISPGAKGLSEAMDGLTFELKKEHRERLLTVNREKLVNVARRYLQDCNAALAICGTPKDVEAFEEMGWSIKRVSSED